MSRWERRTLPASDSGRPPSTPPPSPSRFFAERIKKRISGLTPGALRALAIYEYPGNVRELRNIVERAVILARGSEVEERDIVLPGVAGPPPAPGAEESFFRLAARGENSPPSLVEV